MRKRECDPDGVAGPGAASRTPEAPGPETRGLGAEGALRTWARGPPASGDPAASTTALVARTGNAVGSLDTKIELGSCRTRNKGFSDWKWGERI